MPSVLLLLSDISPIHPCPWYLSSHFCQLKHSLPTYTLGTSLVYLLSSDISVIHECPKNLSSHLCLLKPFLPTYGLGTSLAYLCLLIFLLSIYTLSNSLPIITNCHFSYPRYFSCLMIFPLPVYALGTSLVIFDN